MTKKGFSSVKELQKCKSGKNFVHFSALPHKFTKGANVDP
jgi:hypothetical protein